MAGNLINSLLSLATNLIPSITASAQSPSSSSSKSNNSQKGCARAVEEDLEKLMQTLKWIKATLYDAEEREIRDLSVKLWLKELKKVAFDAEDVFSEYRYEVTRVQVEGTKHSQASSSHKRKQMEYIVPIFDGMVDRLNKIRSRFDEIAKDRGALQLMESDRVRRPNNKTLWPPTSHMMDEVSIFGRDTEITEVIDFLLSEKEKEKSFSVISIVGKGGLGKTTIAQLVYKDERVCGFFDLYGWVCVSQEFDIGRLTKATIESISKINDGLSELSSLQEKLAEIVRAKTMLLVLDDVWNENQSLWEMFRIPFRNANLVRILVTTRNKKVAETMQTTTCFRPTNLTEDSCWQLFQHYASSGTSNNVPTHLVDVGKEIMKKCGGLPLAVKSIASLLRHETDERRWREILESDLWESNPSNDIFSALQISYAHLPAHLKPCFLFCSMYPKDHLLEKMHLIELWISHGYIESKGKRRITEIGAEYYEELKERSFLDDFSHLSSELCKLHDIIHDLARLNSENEYYSVEINQKLDNQERIREAYHLYIRGFVGYVNQILQQNQENLKGLRTLITDVRCHGNMAICNLTNFEALRVLELKVNFTKVPDFIPELKHIVYLSITSMNLKMLSLSIGLLYNLQNLFLDCPFLEYLPENIGDLANLQFLFIQSEKIQKLPKSLSSLSNLLRLVIKCYNLEEIPLDFRNLNNLLGLTIHSGQIQVVPNTVNCLISLEELHLLPQYGLFSIKNELDYVPHDLVNFPCIKTMAARLRVPSIGWLKDMKELEGKLSIEGLENNRNLVDAELANLRNKCTLETLELFWNFLSADFSKQGLILCLIPEAYVDHLISANDVDFSLLECLQPHPNLKNIRISCYPSAILPGWMRDSFSFSLQSIKKISLECCVNIQSLPFGNLHTLKHLTIQNCHSVRDLKLPSQLEELDILDCYALLVLPLDNLHILKHFKINACRSIRVLQLERLEQLEVLLISCCDYLEFITRLGGLDVLVALEITSCDALKSLAMDRLQFRESPEPSGDSSHEKPHIGQQRIPSLKRLKITYCKLLRLLPDGLIPSGPCFVRVWGCSCPDVVRNYRSPIN